MHAEALQYSLAPPLASSPLLNIPTAPVCPEAVGFLQCYRDLLSIMTMFTVRGVTLFLTKRAPFSNNTYFAAYFRVFDAPIIIHVFCPYSTCSVGGNVFVAYSA